MAFKQWVLRGRNPDGCFPSCFSRKLIRRSSSRRNVFRHARFMMKCGFLASEKYVGIYMGRLDDVQVRLASCLAVTGLPRPSGFMITGFQLFDG